MKQLIYLFLFVILFLPFQSGAQTTSQNFGWAALFHSQKFTDKVGAHFDFQMRSADEFDYLRNILIRPGVTYFIDHKKNATLGYALVITNQKLDSALPLENRLMEHRIWEQFIYNQKIGKLPLTHRFRLEQRFIETNADDIFSNRLRYFFRSVIALKPQGEKFNNGLFTALQNEVFLNLQNKDKLNGHTFDQNRAYVAIGHRFNPKFDMEVGYLNQALKGKSGNTVNHAFQIAFYTRL